MTVCFAPETMGQEALLMHVWMSYGDDGIFRIRILPEVSINTEHIKTQNECMRRMAGDQPVPVLVDARDNFSISREAQEYAAQQSYLRLAMAIVSTNSVTRMLVNTYTRIFKPASPVKIFSTEEKALKWLRKKMQEKSKKDNTP